MLFTFITIIITIIVLVYMRAIVLTCSYNDTLGENRVRPI